MCASATFLQVISSIQPSSTTAILATSSIKMRVSTPSSSLLFLAGIRTSLAWTTSIRSITTTGSSAVRHHHPTTLVPRSPLTIKHARPFTRLRSTPISTLPPLSSQYEQHLPLAREAMVFFDSSPDPFHAVQSASLALQSAGFVEWKDNDDQDASSIDIVPGGKYYFTRNKSTLVAFAVGKKYVPGNGFKIIGSHTDSPNLKVKPYSKRTTDKNGGSSGAIQIGAECYGGGLWHTWFDRDLGVSGRVFINDEATDKHNENSFERQELVKIDQAILRIPNLAIHLQTAKEREAFAINKEDHLSPILATAVKESLTAGNSNDDKEKGTDNDGDEWMKHQEPLLVQILAKKLGVDPKSIVDFELNLFDVQPASIGGIHSEFVHSSRLDNLASCFLSLKGLIDHVTHDGLENDSDISMIAMFDHEEVGSSSSSGAGSPIMGEAVRRISYVLGAGEDNPLMYDRAIQRSFVLSVDQAHAVHPNYVSKHEKNHGPKMNGGMVIKRNSNQRYATNGMTGLIVRQIAKKAGLPPIQEFVVRNDCACGSTIGPIISANTGIRAIDMGCPQLSMHSIRETMGTKDFTHGLALFQAFFQHFSSVDKQIED
eukprot:CCRYP_011469-RC/>CCRYP_011469-RC protein AED:0.06 eAED:0.06 QI:90/0.5/0.33/1/0.5/0.33/3/0/598